VESADMGALLTGSKGLVYPSLYEGFGIPVLDGFACDVPVITSDRASLLEVAGDSGIIVDATDENSIAEGIVKALRGPKGWVDKGREQVKKFTWEKTAQMTLDVYNEAIK
jgi:glycosyltransferase involved in cell wall biosynthesis